MKFHPTPELLIKYSAASLSPAMALVVAGHVHHCEACAQSLKNLDDLGGSSIDMCQDSPVKESDFDRLWERLDAHEAIEENDLSMAIASDFQPLLKHLVDGDYNQLDWHTVAGKIERAALNLDDSKNQIEVLRFAANAKIPQHTHKGNEFTLILQGAYDDEMGHFGVGDFIHMNTSHHHRPIAGREGCVCIAVTDAPMHFTGTLGPLLNLFAR